MIRHTGGLAVGATSTRSRSSSWARLRASWIETIPICDPSGPTSRTCGARILSFTRASTETRHYLLNERNGTKRLRLALKGGESGWNRPFKEYRREGKTARTGPAGPFSRAFPNELDRLDVRSLLSLGTFHDVELYLLALGESPVAVTDDRREVNEHVVPIGTSDETVALLVAEPLHGALRQPVTSLHFSADRPRLMRRERSMAPSARQCDFGEPRAPRGRRHERPYHSGWSGRP